MACLSEGLFSERSEIRLSHTPSPCISLKKKNKRNKQRKKYFSLTHTTHSLSLLILAPREPPSQNTLVFKPDEFLRINIT